MLLAGCGPGTQPDASRPDASDSAMEFRGQRPCADCSGIESFLRLEQHEGTRRYRLVEHYRSGERERRFEDAGEWMAEGDTLRLRSRNGGERVYVRMGDGMLQARDARGAPLAGAADDVLVPVTFDVMQ